MSDYDEVDAGIVLLDRDTRKDDEKSESAVAVPDWKTDGLVRFGEQLISLTSSQLDGAKARVLRTLQRYTLKPDVLAKNLDVPVHVLHDLARYALKLDGSKCDHWRRCLGLDWVEFFDLENKYLEDQPKAWEKPPAPKPRPPTAAPIGVKPSTIVTDQVTEKTFYIFDGMSSAQRLLVLRNRRLRDGQKSETEMVDWKSASDQRECKLFGECKLGQDLFNVLSATGVISANWLERRTPKDFDKAGLLPPDKRKPGVEETLAPASFVFRVITFARTVSAGVHPENPHLPNLEEEFVRLQQFCDECEELAT